jgi:hypothetical protein
MTTAQPGSSFPGFFIPCERSTSVQTRSTTYGSRVVHGPVVILVGERIIAERPAPRPFRRMPSDSEADRGPVRVG